MSDLEQTNINPEQTTNSSDISEIEMIPLEEPPVPEVVEETETPTKPNATMEAEVFSPKDKKTTTDVLLPLPDGTHDDMVEYLKSMPNIDMTSTKEQRQWAEMLRLGSSVSSVKDLGIEALKRAGADYRQAVESEKGRLAVALQSFSNMSDQVMSGEPAVARVRQLIGIGSIIQIPLWHSGFWITLKAPSDGTLLELHRRLVEEKIEIGRRTHGLAFANTSVFFAAWIMEFVLSNIYETTCKSGVDWRSKIKALDIPIIAWGMACAIYPRGFPYARSVLESAEEVDGEEQARKFKVIREKINIGKICWTDTNSLTKWQIAHMANRRGPHMTGDMIDKYQGEFTRGQGRVIKVHDNISLTLKSPNMENYFASGQKWIDGIESLVDRTLNISDDVAVRNAYMLDHAKATNLRQWCHWVESIDADGVVISDEESVEKTLDALSSEDSISELYYEGIQKFIEESTISIIAVPATEKNDVNLLPRFPRLIPIDALSTFFILLDQKVQRIRDRE